MFPNARIYIFDSVLLFYFQHLTVKAAKLLLDRPVMYWNLKQVLVITFQLFAQWKLSVFKFLFPGLKTNRGNNFRYLATLLMFISIVL